MGTFLTGKGPLAPLSKPGTLTFVEGTGLAMNTHPAQRLFLLRDAQCAGTGAAGGGVAA